MSHHVITCVVESGRGPAFLERLAAELGVHSAVFFKSRHAVADWSGRRAAVVEGIERDEVAILIADSRLDEVFLWVHAALAVGEPGGGVIFAHRATRATEIVMPA
ncbi:MAG: hypothetical protein HQL38_13530 [Alphaproteobacteria bacterium]|nr:hypothetical protein [Alphaproteobacteria bacterium]MBF0334690.1 hypothetical protein [Alphaproteobacteria bacterium]MBF0393694.1 hypothetical protein [Alphaproteobacteria bacterium]